MGAWPGPYSLDRRPGSFGGNKMNAIYRAFGQKQNVSIFAKQSNGSVFDAVLLLALLLLASSLLWY